MRRRRWRRNKIRRQTKRGRIRSSQFTIPYTKSPDRKVELSRDTASFSHPCSLPS